MEESAAPNNRASHWPLYAALLLGWLLLSGLTVALVVHEAWEDVESEFAAHAEREIEALRGRLQANEAVLGSFVAFLAAIDSPSQQQLDRFAARMLEEHSDIYMLELVEKVDAQSRAAFERALAQRTGGAGGISRFDYDSGRRWGAVPGKAVYYPISFIWPESPQTRQLLGLDLDSVPHLRDTMKRADLSASAASSPPFLLVEGPLAYIMLKRARQPSSPSGAQATAFALLVVKADSLKPSAFAPNTAHVLRTVGADGASAKPLFEAPATEPASALERRILPGAHIDTEDYSTSQPITLGMSRQMRFADIDAQWLGGAGLLSALSLAGVLCYLRRHHGHVLRLRLAHARDSHGALHDPLTGLANRRLLYDRVGQVLAHWNRSGEGFALFFIDLDKFKVINDQHGHDVGDAVLQAVAERMLASVRETDTVSRISGDEFVVLIPGVIEREALESIAEKLLDAIAQPIASGPARHLLVTASLGISQCPADGVDTEGLISSADRAMYRLKRRA